jgi:hypothetical protein
MRLAGFPVQTAEHFAAVVEVIPLVSPWYLLCHAYFKYHMMSLMHFHAFLCCRCLIFCLSVAFDALLQEGLGMENLPYMGGAAVRTNVSTV